MTNSLAAMPIQQLKRAIVIREKIDTLTSELNSLTGIPRFISNGNGNGHHTLTNGKSRGISTAGRARIAAAQRLRWMKFNIARRTNSPAKSAPTSQRLSSAGRAKVSAAVKARWERYRAEKARNARAK